MTNSTVCSTCQSLHLIHGGAPGIFNIILLYDQSTCLIDMINQHVLIVYSLVQFVF